MIRRCNVEQLQPEKFQETTCVWSWLTPCHPLVLFWWMTLHRRIASQFGVYWPNGRALPIVLMTATNWPASWINHWIVQGKCSVVASKCRWNVSFSIVDGNSSSQMKGCCKCMVSQRGWNCPKGCCVWNFACCLGQVSTSLDRIPPCLPVIFLLS